MTEATAFFTPDGDALVPGPEAEGPWSPGMLHGRLLAGLAGRAAERDYGDAEFQFTRLTVDLFRSPPMEPVRVETESVRDGRRVRTVEARLHSAGNEVARASVQMLRRGEHPVTRVWQPPPWDVPLPDDLEPVAVEEGRPGAVVWDMRAITPGGFGAVTQRRLWLRERRALVAGEPLTPWVRIAMVADFTNPFTNFGGDALHFINADLTLYLARLPRGEWLGFEAAGHLGHDGVAIGHANVYDVEGPIGHCSVAAVATAPITRQPGAGPEPMPG
jgi:hypothetical protein